MLTCLPPKLAMEWRPDMRRLLLVALLASLLLGRFAAAQDRFPGAEWEHVPPAPQAMKVPSGSQPGPGVGGAVHHR